MLSKQVKERLKKITPAYRAYCAAHQVYRAARPALATTRMALARPVYGLCREAREVPVVVSMASYRARFGVVNIALKSILLQTEKPDKIVLNIDKEDEPFLPKKVLDLQGFGVEIKARDDGLKPHKKWFYAFQENPNAAVITVDDDIIYPKTMIAELLASYRRHPTCVSARRVHLMTKDAAGRLKPYNSWRQEYKGSAAEPAHSLFVTTGGGALFPLLTMPRTPSLPQGLQACYTPPHLLHLMPSALI